MSAGHPQPQKVTALAAVLLAVVTGGCLAPPAFEGTAGTDQPVIVLSAAGDPSPAAHEAYAGIGRRCHARFPANDIRWAFASEEAVTELNRQGLPCQTPRETAKTLAAKGYKAVAWQSLYVMPGEGMSLLAALGFSEMAVTGGAALLDSDRDYYRVIEAIAPHIVPGIPNLLVFHGETGRGGTNREIVILAEMLKKLHPEVIVASWAGRPGADAPLALARQRARQAGAVHILPMMIAPHRVFNEDVLGDRPTSWKNRLGAVRVTCAPPLGGDPRIQAIYLQHLEEALHNLEENE